MITATSGLGAEMVAVTASVSDFGMTLGILGAFVAGALLAFLWFGRS
jgi:uncharacterized integral membrane protein